jgi:hypothetical protein
MPPVQTSADLVDALPPYILSDSVADVADAVIAEHDAFRILNDIRMGYAERTDAKTEDDADIDDVIGVKRAGPLWGSLGEYDVVLWVKADWWHLMGKGAARAAAVTHALSHVLVTDEGKIKLVGHDVDAFIRETVKFGPWSSRLSRLWRSMGRDPRGEAEAVAQATVDALDGTTLDVGDGVVAHISIGRKATKPPVVTP